VESSITRVSRSDNIANRDAIMDASLLPLFEEEEASAVVDAVTNEVARVSYRHS
jgi:hypothetical protein